MAFSFEDLKVYRDSISWVEAAHRALEDLGPHCPLLSTGHLYADPLV